MLNIGLSCAVVLLSAVSLQGQVGSGSPSSATLLGGATSQGTPGMQPVGIWVNNSCWGEFGVQVQAGVAGHVYLAIEVSAAANPVPFAGGTAYVDPFNASIINLGAHNGSSVPVSVPGLGIPLAAGAPIVLQAVIVRQSGGLAISNAYLLP